MTERIYPLTASWSAFPALNAGFVKFCPGHGAARAKAVLDYPDKTVYNPNMSKWEASCREQYTQYLNRG